MKLDVNKIVEVLVKMKDDVFYFKSYSPQIIESYAEEVAVEFSKWLIKKCDYQSHGVWDYKGMEFTQKELFNVFIHDDK